MWRGAKLGFKVLLVLYGVNIAVLVPGAIIVLTVSGRLGDVLRDVTPWLVLQVIGYGVFGIPIGAAVYGAIPGAVVMGICGAIRWRPSAIQHSPDDISSGGDA